MFIAPFLPRRRWHALGASALALLAVAACSRRESTPAADETPAPAITGNSFAIVGASVFDGVDARGTVTIIVENGLVTGLGADMAVPEGLSVIDGAGLTVLPGLIDAHVHTFEPAALNDAVRFGVTTVLDQFTAHQFLATVKARRDGLENTAAADIFSAGTLVTSAGGHGTQFGLSIPTIASPAEAPAFVKARLAEGSDWIKIAYEPDSLGVTSVDAATLEAVVAAAHAEGVLAVVHVSSLEAARTAVLADADGLVHLFADAPADDALLAEMAARDTFVIPTLSIIASAADKGAGPALTEDPNLKPFLSPAQASGLVQGFGLPVDHPYRQRLQLDVLDANVRALAAAGVEILAGTDAPNPGTVQGVSQHGELAALVSAGLSPQAALTAATSAPATAFGLSGRGRIAEGARADLVLVEGDPLTDITATRAIRHVFKNGYEVPRAAPAEVAIAATAPNLPDGLVSDMEGGFNSGFGVPWYATTDAIAAGTSTATLATATGADGTGEALRIEGEVTTKFFFPWAGAGLFFSPDMKTAYDLSGYERIRFMARGAPRKYVLMLSTRTSRDRPATREFALTEEWTEVVIDLPSVRGASTDEVFWIALTAGRPAGAYWFEIDDVRFE